LSIGCTTLTLLGERAVFWPAADALLVSDLHLGKGESFRRAGLAIPRGLTRDDLARLTALLAATRAARLLILGDVLHGALHAEAGWREDWAAFRDTHRGVSIEAIVGNHDRALPSGAQALGMVLLPEGQVEHGIALCHEPDHAPPTVPSLCGHLHPATIVPGLGRLPAYWWRSGRQQLVLPAFTGFSGRIATRPDTGDILYACAGHAVLAIPTREPPQRRWARRHDP
jgi:DNA ligase-associated metallophosphoesterase